MAETWKRKVGLMPRKEKNAEPAIENYGTIWSFQHQQYLGAREKEK
jgi:hypothetical protein